jgi:3-oxoacyl-[acyl-carrier-protein] synthase III
MRWDDFYISSSAACLGSVSEDVRAAAAEGRYDPEECEADGYLHTRVAGDDESAADMAIKAAKLALSRADIDPDNVVLVMHGATGGQGLYYWPGAAYIQNQTVGGRAMSAEVKQMSNSGMAVFELAAAYLLTKPTPSSALVTTAEIYTMPHFDRYRSDKGQVRGDGASAIVLSRGTGGGVAKLLSTASIGDATHERLYRGDQPWENYPGANGWPLDLRIRTKEYLMSGAQIPDIITSVAANQHKVIDEALDDAGVSLDDVARFIFPNTGLTLVDWEARKREFGMDVSKSTWDWGRHMGHMGGGDQAAGLTHLLETRAVHPGDKVILTGIGGGFNFSCAVLEILEQPEWSNSTT